MLLFTAISTILIQVSYSQASATQCAYLNSGGIGIPLDYCHVASQDGVLTPFQWTCDANDELVINIWYGISTCFGPTAYSSAYSDFEDVEDYSCTGSGSACSGVILKMYDNTTCLGSTWSKMRLITDRCFEGENDTSIIVECDVNAADAYSYGDTVCSDSAFLQRSSFLEADDQCTQVIDCDVPDMTTEVSSTSTTNSPISTSNTAVTATAIMTTESTTSTTTDPDSCSYVNLGGSGVPLGYCHRVSTQYLGDTSFDFSCASDSANYDIEWTTYSNSRCSSSNVLNSMNADYVYSVQSYNCGGSVDNCQTVEIKTYSSNSCSGDNWRKTQFIIDECFDAADGGSQKYICTRDDAHIVHYSDGDCHIQRNITEIVSGSGSCYKVLECSSDAESTTSTSFISTTVNRITDVVGPHDHTYSDSSSSAFSTGTMVLGAAVFLVCILVIVVCGYRRKQRRLEQEIAHMTMGVTDDRRRARQVNRNNQYMNVNINNRELMDGGGGAPARDGSDVVITAYA